MHLVEHFLCVVLRLVWGQCDGEGWPLVWECELDRVGVDFGDFSDAANESVVEVWELDVGGVDAVRQRHWRESSRV